MYLFYATQLIAWAGFSSALWPPKLPMARFRWNHLLRIITLNRKLKSQLFTHCAHCIVFLFILLLFLFLCICGGCDTCQSAVLQSVMPWFRHESVRFRWSPDSCCRRFSSDSVGGGLFNGIFDNGNSALYAFFWDSTVSAACACSAGSVSTGFPGTSVEDFSIGMYWRCSALVWVNL